LPAARKKNSFKELFNRKKKSIADTKVIIILARKIIAKIGNFITNCEI
jgi:hypothetical protein